MQTTMEQLVSLAKRRGFIFPGSEIYGGLANTWDYGPLGAQMKQNIKQVWWRQFIEQNPYNVGLDSAILMNRSVWVASGHVGNFNDPMVDCRQCKSRYRADKLIEEAAEARGEEIIVDGLPFEQMDALLVKYDVQCPECGAKDFTSVRQFNMMFKTHQGVTEEAANEVYLRPETAQGIFVNFKNVQRAMRKKLPFGIGQIGKSFRNEITPGNFTFRTREFEQMELEFFCAPGEDMEWFRYWRQFCYDFLLSIGMKEENLRLRDHEKEQLSHYSTATTDVEYKFPFGWGELLGVADRTDYDLKAHATHSGENMTVQEEGQEPFIPYCIEPSIGVDRLFLALFADAYDEEEVGENDTRVVLRLHPAIAPYKAAVFPLSKKLSEAATQLYTSLSKQFSVDYDESGSIGKRYRRHDEIGTPYCITYDFESETDHAVTIRHRDSMEQERVAIADVAAWLNERIGR
ncbi:glycine--tRNA ligase [Alicyclobacillus acidoterrestris]|uniref:Glycine--tRNA ligase n=1 Tax=Alicyclobacillus acidoterrestris (strain ATCC 49025 / DSM 3922 / CIP 106132 / NCIMB 13137 / GD3B) TaxID=1356854 RepID=T0BPF1_ALIAG|nr:glycine--tRNA ligase [Alicyclobacillus acidoterrestris]EPZ42435.1 glycyl-tRNA synthetase [Alicyclobacillus acidoterrestris ATCC 49025]UNO47239.1 glycine--tRNA ligase [Alicyclobacillus acidoterrestris]